MKYFCCDSERRRSAVKAHPTLNGIDFVEVFDDADAPFSERQRTLFLNLLKNVSAGQLGPENFLIEGGERIRNIEVTEVSFAAMEPPPAEFNILALQVSEPGDFSTYTLRIVRALNDPRPLDGFDPILSAVDFSFKVACPSDFDCRRELVCPPEAKRPPDISYLAKDYASFRRLLLDRLAVLMPEWKERSPADVGIALVELLAYVGDHLSYQQDAVATEAYLNTARRRVSVRRHVRLVDYFLHNGTNARAWVQVRLGEDVPTLNLLRQPGERITQFLTRVPDQGQVLKHGERPHEAALLARPTVFEPVRDTTLYREHNEMQFHTWGNKDCCLPKGATRATLRGEFPNLRAGDVLVFLEVLGPNTGLADDADPGRRHAVLLTKVDSGLEDPLGDPDNPGSPPMPITEIEWHTDDALPFPFCISKPDFADVSVALGNIVLADHGLTIEEPLSPVPEPNPALVVTPAGSGDPCTLSRRMQLPARYRPRLQRAPVAHRDWNRLMLPVSAAAAMSRNPRTALPELYLNEAGSNARWEAKADLLNSSASAKEFVAEVEQDGRVYLRFGDDRFGSRPAAGTEFNATYRVGNGLAGNVGADTIYHIATDDPVIVSDLSAQVIERVWNPLPAVGGIEPETIEEARQNAPSAFRVQERAVTPEDYAEMARRCSLGIQRAAATFRWTGSWRTVFVTVDRMLGRPVDEPFKAELRNCLEKFRMAGHDVEVDSARPVSLEIEMRVCLKPGYFASDVKSSLLELFSNRILPGGRRGLFHPDNFTFGQPVYLSPLIAAAQSVEGVASLVITKFQRQGNDSEEGKQQGKLTFGRLEIARLDNDPNFPEHGVFRLFVENET